MCWPQPSYTTSQIQHSTLPPAEPGPSEAEDLKAGVRRQNLTAARRLVLLEQCSRAGALPLPTVNGRSAPPLPRAPTSFRSGPAETGCCGDAPLQALRGALGRA